MFQKLQRDAVGIALPDDVAVTHRERNRLILHDIRRDIGEDAVAQGVRVVEPDDRDPRAPCFRKVLKDALPAEARRRILTDRARGIVFRTASAIDGDERIDVSR
ncbi:hypothetical protein D3C83_69740 [compost metagenome]